MTPGVARIGMFGGTFDPVHLGHLRSAVELREALLLDCVHMIPAPSPPLRGAPQVDASQRLALLEAGVADTPGLKVDARELDRAGPSYSVDTLSELRDEYGPSARLVMAVGVDAFSRFAQWERLDALFELAHVVVMARPGYDTPWSDALRELLGHREVDDVAALMASPSGGILVLSLPSRIDVSATELRERLADGRSVRYLLPDAVERAIATQKLYRR